MNRPESEQRWRAQLQQLQVPKGFQEQLHHNLSSQLRARAKAKVRQRLVWNRVAGGAALALIIGFLVVNPFTAPPLIAAAQAHAAEERNVGDIDLAYSLWLTEAGLRGLPRESQVAMAKDCVVAGRTARHLRVAMGRSAYADVFITEANDEARGATQGKFEGRSWWQWQPQAGVTVVVLFDSQITDVQRRIWTEQLARG